MLPMQTIATRNGSFIAPTLDGVEILNRVYPRAPDSPFGIIHAAYYSQDMRGRRADSARYWLAYYSGPRREARADHDAQVQA